MLSLSLKNYAIYKNTYFCKTKMKYMDKKMKF